MKKPQTMLKLLVLLLAVAWFTPSLAQISAGGTPPSFSYNKDEAMALQSKSTAQLAIDINFAALKKEDVERSIKHLPPRIGVYVPVNYTTENSGEWTTLPNGQRIWRLTIEAPGALAMTLEYSKFDIPAGGKLFLYTPDRSRVIGAFVEGTNTKGAEYATELLQGSTTILEYVEPMGVTTKTSPIVIYQVLYGYNDMYLQADGDGPWYAAGACMVNINCAEGAEWQHEKTGIARTLTAGYLCSGTLVNNTAWNLDPLFLTAWHCLRDEDDVAFTAAQMNAQQLWFHYESPGCTNASGTGTRVTMIGSTKLVENPLPRGADGALVRLNSQPLESYGLYYNGWDRRGTAPPSGVSIHHPDGDIKKISTYETSTIVGNLNFGYGTGNGTAANGHFYPKFVQTANGFSVTEGGSSGGPMFDENKRVVGTLSGGSGDCANPAASSSFYGRLFYHWDQWTDQSQWMKPYLDPIDSGEEFVDGTYYAGSAVAAFVADRTDIYAMESVQFTDNGNGAETWAWEFAGGTPATSTEANPRVQYTAPGTYTVKLTINAGEDNESVEEKIDYIVVKLKRNEEEIIIGTGTTTVANPMQLQYNYSWSRNYYMANEIKSGAGATITSMAFYSASTSTQPLDDVYFYLQAVPSTETGNAVNTYIDPVAAGATLVWNKSQKLPGAAGWVTFEFDTPFVLPAGVNLLVYCDNKTGSWSGPSTTFRYTATPTNTAVYAQYDSPASFPPTPTATGTRNNNRVNMRLALDAGPPTAPVADFTMNGATTTPINIFQGETIDFVSISTGPPVLWDWTLTGTTGVSSSTATTVSATYMTEGTHSTTLKVTNTLGEDTETKSIVVTARAPGLRYNVSPFSNALMMQSGGAFLSPEGGEITFEDNSDYYPTSWSWTLPGATPASSTASEVTAVYPAGENTYNVSLDASNNGGTTSSTKTDYVKVGGAKTDVTNIVEGETFTGRYLNGTYPMNGAHMSLFPQMAEYFTAPAGGEVSRVRVYTMNVTQATSASMTLAIHADINGVPGALIYQATPIQGGSNRITNGGYTNFNFATPVAVPAKFHVVVGTTGTGVNFTVGGSPDRLETSGYNSLSVSYQGAWRNLSALLVAGSCYSTNIVPEFVYTTSALTGESEFRSKDVDATVHSTTVSSTGSGWNAVANNPWIVLGAASGAITGGEGTITFTCANNTDPKMRRGSISIYAGGEPFRIDVIQGGSFPANFAARYDEEAENILVTWGDGAVEAAGPLATDWFDGVENHPDFMVNSPGSGAYRWSYIDGDDNVTFGVQNLTFPGSQGKMAYIVFNPSATTPALNGGDPHNGSKYFACFGSDGTPTDDWMISPELGYTTDFKFSFWARSYHSSYLESMRVVYSTTGKNKADFTNVLVSVSSVPADWTNYNYTVPANAKYVAIHCNSDDKFIFLVDDIFIGTGPVPAPVAPATPVSNDNMLYSRAVSAPMPEEFKPLNQLRGVFAAMETSIDAASAIQSAPNLAPQEVVLRWDDGTNGNAVGTANGGDMEVAAMFAPEDMNYSSATIKAVEIYPSKAATNMVLRISQGSNTYTQALSGITFGAFNTITLTTPFEVNVNQDLYVGYSFTQAAGQDNYVPGTDLGPAVRGKGDLIALGGDALASLYSVTGGQIDCNWNIAVVMDAEAGAETTYRLFRDGSMLAEDLTVERYRDMDITIGETYCYTITATYEGDDFFESVQAPAICVYTKSVINIATDDKEKIENEPNELLTGVITGLIVAPETTYDDIFTLSYSTDIDESTVAGEYPIVATVVNLLPARYVVKKTDAIYTVNEYPTVIGSESENIVIACENTSATFYVTLADGLEITYQWQKRVLDTWQNISGANENTYTINNITPADAGVYRAVVSGRTSIVHSADKVLKVALAPSNILVFEWADVPTINCNTATNGGYTFVSFQWYKNGAAMPGATKPYVLAEESAVYDCEMVANDGRIFRICNYTYTPVSATLSVYPNPATPSQNVTVKLSKESQGSVINIYSTGGGLVKGNIPMNGIETSININGLSAGMYVIQVSSPNGVKRTTTLVVK